MFLFPYRTDVPFDRFPVMNVTIIGLAALTFVMQLADASFISVLVLDGWRVSGLVGYMWIHGGIIHLLGNLWFLWLFGNATSLRIGQFAFLGIYILSGLAGAVLHILCNGSMAVGASAAINGIVGAYLVLYPTAPVSCFYFLLFVRGGAGTFTMRGAWLILLWFAFDIWGAASGRGGVAYWAHLGGFLFGMSAALLLLQSGFIHMASYEISLVELLGFGKKPRSASRKKSVQVPRRY